MRLLIVSNFYTPMVSPRAFRWATIAEHWVGQGHDVDVVCAWISARPRHEILNGVHLHRVGKSMVQALREWVRQPSTGVGRDGRMPGTSYVMERKRRLAAFTKWVHDHTWKRIYWPDYACLWYFPALIKGKQLLASRRHDGLVTVSIPFTSHLVGLRLKRALPSIRWVVDIGDPFSFSDAAPQNNQKLYQRLNYYAERIVFGAADAVTVTTGQTLQRYATVFPESAEKTRVVPPLVSIVESEPGEDAVFSGAGKLRLMFMGTLYKHIRNPDFLLQLFARVLQTSLADRVELHFFGNIHDCEESFGAYRSLLGEKIFLHGVVSHETAIRAMHQADILVNIGNRTAHQVPSKVVEYACVGKPILSLMSRPDDASARLLESYPAALCVMADQASLHGEPFARLLRFIERPPSIEDRSFTSELSAFQPPSIASSYERLLNHGS